MTFQDLTTLPFVFLYAGDMPDSPEYRQRPKVGLSLTRNDDWHIRHDARQALPLPDESVDIYQSEDVFEHIEYDRLPAVVRDIWRVLKKDGLFRLSVPDYRCDVIKKRTLYNYEGKEVFDTAGSGVFDLLTFTVREGGHVWFPKYESVKALLDSIPFSSVRFLHFYDENDVPHLEPIDYSRGYVDRTPDHDERVANPRRPLSLVVDCIK